MSQSLHAFLTEIADAIRTQKNTTAEINANDFVDEILKLGTEETLSYANDGTLPTFLHNLAEAIRLKRQITDKINAQNFASEILKIVVLDNDKTTAILGKAILGYAILGNGQPLLSTPSIWLFDSNQIYTYNINWELSDKVSIEPYYATIDSDGQISTTVSCDESYYLPETISVSGVDIYSWVKMSDSEYILTLSSPNGNPATPINVRIQAYRNFVLKAPTLAVDIYTGLLTLTPVTNAEYYIVTIYEDSTAQKIVNTVEYYPGVSDNIYLEINQAASAVAVDMDNIYGPSAESDLVVCEMLKLYQPSIYIYESSDVDVKDKLAAPTLAIDDYGHLSVTTDANTDIVYIYINGVFKYSYVVANPSDIYLSDGDTIYAVAYDIDEIYDPSERSSTLSYIAPSYSFTLSLNNAKATSAIPTSIKYGNTYTINVEANDGYELPSSLTSITGTCEAKTWNHSTGSLIIKNPKSNMIITITASEISDILGKLETPVIRIEEEAEEHTHSYTTSTVAAACTTQGYTLHTCSCGNTYKDNYTAALGHTEEAVPGYAATCTETGLTDGKKCSVCGETLLAQEEIAALGHNFVTYVSNGDATCTEDGTKTAKCTRCSVTNTITDVDSKLGHNWSAPYTSAVDFPTTGYGRKCTRCGLIQELTPDAEPLDTPNIWLAEELESPTIAVDAVSGEVYLTDYDENADQVAVYIDDAYYATYNTEDLEQGKETLKIQTGQSVYAILQHSSEKFAASEPSNVIEYTAKLAKPEIRIESN